MLPLHHARMWYAGADSNRLPPDFQSAAHPYELPAHMLLLPGHAEHIQEHLHADLRQVGKLLPGHTGHYNGADEVDAEQRTVRLQADQSALFIGTGAR